jgi:NTE family protein
MKNKQKIALVLSGGGAKGLAHIGAIEVLEKHGFDISAISGTSAGALIGGIYAMGYLDKYKNWVEQLKRKDIIALMDFTISGGGLIKGKRVFDKMKSFMPDKKIEDLSLPFTAVAVDILNNKEILFNTGSVYEAMRASVSVPDVFVPVRYGNTLLVDGGVLNPVPIDVVKRTDDDKIFVVNLYDTSQKLSEIIADDDNNSNNDEEYSSKIIRNLKYWQKKIFESINKKDKVSLGYLKLTELTMDTMVHKIAQMTIEKFKPDLVVNVPADSAGLFDFDKAEKLIQLGRDLTEKALEEYPG